MEKGKKPTKAVKAIKAVKTTIPEYKHPNEKVSDREIEEALIINEGSPVRASRYLELDYSTVYLRIRKNPKLKAVQASYRARTHQDMVNTALKIAVHGLITEPVVDDDGNVIKGQFKEKKVDYGTRTNVIMKLADMYKGEDGVIDNINIISDGQGVQVSDWLQRMEEARRDKDNESKK